MCIPPLAPTPPAQGGSTNMPSSIAATQRAWPICAPCRTGICAISLKLFLALQKWQALADSCASIKATSIPRSSTLMESPPPDVNSALALPEVASIGRCVRQYQVNLEPKKLRSYGISAATVIDKVRQSTNEVGGDVLEIDRKSTRLNSSH